MFRCLIYKTTINFYLQVETFHEEPNLKNLLAKCETNIQDSNLTKQTTEILNPLENSISKISVEEFYGKEAFLENNLGIEKDPQLVEIVQAQEKTLSITSSNEDNHDNKVYSPLTNISEINLEVEHSPLLEINKQDKINDPELLVSEQKLCCSPNIIEVKKEYDPKLEHENSVYLISNEEESNENIKEKERHLFSLGLLTREAADAAVKEKSMLRELRNRNENSKIDKRFKNSEYTGTLKTVIKLNKTAQESKKTRLPLKMTIHKGKGKSCIDDETCSNLCQSASTTYTIQNDQQVSF